jgi:2-iminobutanoate/2-iminopropanoate deaminase
MVEIVSGPMFPPAVGPYSPAAITTGDSRIAFIAGQVAADDSGNIVGVGDFRAQFRQVMVNLDRALKALGGTFEDLLYVRGNLVRVEDFPAYTEERTAFYEEVCPNGAPPTTSLIVAALYHPDCLIEIDAVAALAPK